MSAPDPIAALRSFLLADAEIAGLVGPRVFGLELPRAEAQAMPRKAIVLKPSGGPKSFGGGYQRFGDGRVDALCYGETPYEAWRVQQALLPVLKQMERNLQGDCVLHWASQAGGPLPLRDPDTDWPLNFTSWQVLAAEVAPA